METDHPVIAHIRTRLSAHQPVAHPEGEARAAAVAIVLRAGAGELSVLFIRRAEYAADPWSGQIAFPGGRHEPGDSDLFATALRETLEETGVDLRAAEVLGTLDDLHSTNPGLPNIFVRPFVLAVVETGQMKLSAEVADAFWVPLSVLRDATVWREATVTARGRTFPVRACHFEGRLIWGMTERILSQLLTLAFDANLSASSEP